MNTGNQVIYTICIHVQIVLEQTIIYQYTYIIILRLIIHYRCPDCAKIDNYILVLT